jgi:hypothetical protein
MKKNLFSLRLFLPHKLLIFTLCLSLLLGTTVSPVSAATITVTRIDDPAGPVDGRACIPSTDCSLRGAILAANANLGADTINLSTGTYILQIAGTDETAAAGDLDITDDLTITGAGADKTIIDGSGIIDRVFDVRPSGVTLTINISRVKITGGNLPNAGPNVGAGIAVRSAFTNLTLSEVVIDGNTTGTNGGGIAVLRGLLSNPIPNLTIDRSTISNNTGLAGGGIICTNCAMTITNSAIIGNTSTSTAANGGGGGITVGGTSGGVLTLSHSTVSGNIANSYGGGIWRNGGNTHVVVDFSTITNNIADNDTDGVNGGDGGGIYNSSTPPDGDFTIKNSIVLDNTDRSTLASDDCGGANLISGGYNVVLDGKGCPSVTSDDKTGSANLGLLADNGGPTRSHMPGAGSTAIDRSPDGANGCTANSTTDQRSVVRGIHTSTACDSGAIEVDATPSYRQCSLTAGRDYNMGPGVFFQPVTLGTLGCVTITHYSTNHPNATPRLQTGKYWNIDGGAATGFDVSLTLPDTLTIPIICKYISGSTWDCLKNGPDNGGSVTRTGIDSFSDWTVGENPGTTAVQLDRFGVSQAGGLAGWGLLGAAVVIGLLAILLRRRKYPA